MSEPSFPCQRIPDEPSQARLLGLYRQCQEGLWLQRVRVPAGRLGGDQWRALAAIVRRFTPATPLHLTTRQDVEIHDLPAEQVPAVQQALAEAGLTGFAAAGDTVRNITVCVCSGNGGRVDLNPLADAMARALASVDGIYALPRKFKIALACGESCGQPWINDLGLTARIQDGQIGFRVTAGGSLGPRPGTASLLFDWLDGSDAVALAVAVIRVFAAHGDRANRGKARLRHVRERIGAEAFNALIGAAFESAKGEARWPTPPLRPANGPALARRTLVFPNGDVPAEAADALGRLADDARLCLRIANQHQVVVFGPDEAALDAALAGEVTLRCALQPGPLVVACPGRRWCARAIVHTNPLADRIRAELAGQLPAGVTVCISGCPNGCAQSAVADIGLIGAVSSAEGQRQEAFNLYAGGGMGRNDNLARLVASKLSAQEAFDLIRLGMVPGVVTRSDTGACLESTRP